MSLTASDAVFLYIWLKIKDSNNGDELKKKNDVSNPEPRVLRRPSFEVDSPVMHGTFSLICVLGSILSITIAKKNRYLYLITASRLRYWEENELNFLDE